MPRKRRSVVWILAGLATALPVQASGGPEATVYKDPNCGCCKEYIRHLEESGYRVEAVDTRKLNDVKREHGVSPRLAACHTTLIDGYVVEGHVPVPLIERLLRERPEIPGIALPGMPQGSPGMSGIKAEPFTIYTISPAAPRIYAVH